MSPDWQASRHISSSLKSVKSFKAPCLFAVVSLKFQYLEKLYIIKNKSGNNFTCSDDSRRYSVSSWEAPGNISNLMGFIIPGHTSIKFNSIYHIEHVPYPLLYEAVFELKEAGFQLMLQGGSRG